MKLKTILEAGEYRITEGSEYLWSCFGQDARSLNMSMNSDAEQEISVIFDSKTQFIYQVEFFDTISAAVYSWTAPDFIEAYFDEGKERGIELTDLSGLEMVFVNVNSPEEMIETIHQAKEGYLGL